jgi:hypothetical protein
VVHPLFALPSAIDIQHVPVVPLQDQNSFSFFEITNPKQEVTMKTKLSFLTAMLLSIAMISQTTIPEGPIEGTWTLSGSPYLIEGTTTIEDGKLLTIEPGVVVEWQGSYTMYVQGRILAQGTVDDTITFTAADPAVGFRSIRFENTPTTNDTSHFDFCRLEYGKVYGNSPDNCGGAIGVINYSKIVIQHCLFYKNKALLNSDDGAAGGAIALDMSNIHIKNSKFLKNESQAGAGVIAYNYSNPFITGCEFVLNKTYDDNVYGNGYGGAISIYKLSSPEITWNVFESNTADIAGGAIGMVDTCNPTIAHNLFFGNWADWLGGAIEIQQYCKSQIINNTIVGNTCGSYGGGIDMNKENEPVIKNNILWNNTAPFGNQVSLKNITSTPEFYYCDIQGGREDIYNEQYIVEYLDCLDADPIFEDAEEHDYHLTGNSPCIDSGDPDMIDPDGTRCDIGAYYYDQVVGLLQVSGEPSLIDMMCHPNPVNNNLTVRVMSDADDRMELTVLTAVGERIKYLEFSTGANNNYEVPVDMGDLPAGLYFVSLRSADKTVIKRVIKR